MDWTAIIVALVGGGAVSALITAIFNSCKTKADADKTRADAYAVISGVYEERLTKLTDRATMLEARVEKLEGVIAVLRDEVEERDDMIDALKRENAELRDEVSRLTAKYNHQIEVNREQGQKLSQLKRENQKLTLRIQTLEEHLSKLDGT